MLKLVITAWDKQPPDIQILARNKSTYEVCGYTEQDGYEVVEDIPSGFVQCALPPQYGAEHLSLAQITRGLMMEQGALEEMRTVASLAFVTMAQAEQFDDITIAEHAELFLPWTPEFTGKRGDIVNLDGQLYKALHDIGIGQNQNPAGSDIWKPIGNPADEWPMWSQPISGVDNPYMLGDKVSHNGKKWVSDINTNWWEPGAYGWSEAK